MKVDLSQKGYDLEERDFFEERFTEDELRTLIGKNDVEQYFSFRSPSFRKMGIDKGGLSDRELLLMMVKEPRLIRRPLIELDGELVVGTDKKKMGQLLK